MMLRKLRIKFLLFLMSLPMSGYIRARLAIKAGCRLNYEPEDHGHFDLFLGYGVQIDSIHPEYIEFGNWTTVATGVVILTHFLNPRESQYPFFSHDLGYVRIGRGCFIGANSIICKSVTIGNGSIVAAGSVVLTDIPPYEIWGGNPARFLKKREMQNNS